MISTPTRHVRSRHLTISTREVSRIREVSERIRIALRLSRLNGGYQVYLIGRGDGYRTPISDVRSFVGLLRVKTPWGWSMVDFSERIEDSTGHVFFEDATPLDLTDCRKLPE